MQSTCRARRPPRAPSLPAPLLVMKLAPRPPPPTLVTIWCRPLATWLAPASPTRVIGLPTAWQQGGCAAHAGRRAAAITNDGEAVPAIAAPALPPRTGASRRRSPRARGARRWTAPQRARSCSCCSMWMRPGSAAPSATPSAPSVTCSDVRARPRAMLIAAASAAPPRLPTATRSPLRASALQRAAFASICAASSTCLARGGLPCSSPVLLAAGPHGAGARWIRHPFAESPWDFPAGRRIGQARARGADTLVARPQKLAIIGRHEYGPIIKESRRGAKGACDLDCGRLRHGALRRHPAGGAVLPRTQAPALNLLCLPHRRES